MKKFSTSVLLIVLIASVTANAQLRKDLSSPYDYSGPIIQTEQQTVQGGLDRFFQSFNMSHSYEMNFSSFGGNYQNINAYTNTMTFALSPDLMGRVDVSFLHSPFGNNFAAGPNNVGNQVIIRNAELNYKISDKAFIRFQYQQQPTGFGYNPYYNGYNSFGRRSYDYGRNGFWY